MKRAAPGILLLMLAWATSCLFPAGVETRARHQGKSPPVKWNEVLKRNAEWYATDDAVRIADSVLLYQRNSGGWPKNMDMAAVLTAAEKTKLGSEKDETDSTIDNGGTYTQLRYLARVYAANNLDRHKESFVKGVEYLLKAQYANGGWPQFFPLRSGYYSHITYNDDAMINVMELLRDISQNKSPFDFVDDSWRARAVAAINRGVECILKTQVIVQGRRTVW